MDGAESVSIRRWRPSLPAHRPVWPAALGVGVTGAVLVLLLNWRGATHLAEVAGFLPAVFAAVGGLVLLGTGSRPAAPHSLLLGAALLLWGAGQTINAFTPGGSFPGPGDLISLLAGPLGIVGGLFMLRSAFSIGGLRQLALDSVLLGAAVTLPVWQFGFAQGLPRPGQTWSATSQLTAIAVAMFLSVLVGGAFLAYLRDLDRNLLLLTGGLLLYAVGELLIMRFVIADGWSLTGSVLNCLAWPMIAAGLLAYDPGAAAQHRSDRLDSGVYADNRGMRVTTVATIALLLVALVALLFDPSPARSSISLVAVAIGVFGVRELVNAATRRALLARLHDEATEDPLTGLANRRVLAARMSRIPEGESWCLLAVDLDGFKDVNDLLGHAVGDDLLAAVARRLAEVAPDKALVSRIGGDEFAVLLRGDIDVGSKVGADIVTAVRQSAADVEGVARVEVSASVGVAAVHRDAATGATLAPVTPSVIDLRDGAAPGDDQEAALYVPAQVNGVSTASGGVPIVTSVDPLGALSASGAALRVAKAAGRNRVEVYDEQIARSRRRRLLVEDRLRHAVETDAIQVRFQPIMDLRRGVVAGAEALARWVDPELGPVDPGEFITVAEQTGLVVALGERVLDQALTTAARERLFDRGLRLSWNVSPVQLRVAGFPRVVAETIKAHNAPRELLVMEVTENVLVEEGEAAQTLHRLARLGVTIAIDDFGTGYSALGYLHRLPADILKIDRSLTSSLVAEPRSRAITRAVLDLGRTVGLSVVVEGVESDQIDDLVRRMGVGYGQGMLYGAAMTGRELGALADRLAKPGVRDQGIQSGR